LDSKNYPVRVVILTGHNPLYAGKITISGKDGADAKPYQEKEILSAIRKVEDAQNDG
jgi:hypothetical protein